MCCIIPGGPTLVVILYCFACQIKWIITLQAKFGSRTRVWHPCSTLTPVFSFRFNPIITTVLSIYPCLCLTRAPRSVFCQCVSSSFPWSFAIPWKCFSWTTTSWSAFPNQCAASTASLSFTSPSESCCLSYPFMSHAGIRWVSHSQCRPSSFVFVLTVVVMQLPPDFLLEPFLPTR